MRSACLSCDQPERLLEFVEFVPVTGDQLLHVVLLLLQHVTLVLQRVLLLLHLIKRLVVLVNHLLVLLDLLSHFLLAKEF